MIMRWNSFCFFGKEIDIIHKCQGGKRKDSPIRTLSSILDILNILLLGYLDKNSILKIHGVLKCPGRKLKLSELNNPLNHYKK